MINKNKLISLTQELLRINSENPPGNEFRIAGFVRQELELMGFQVKSYEFAKKRPNIIGILKGMKSKETLLLSPHLDTVPAGGGWRFNPYAAKIYKGRIYGRGSTDCKGNLACALAALRSIRQDRTKLNKTLIFAATADEETGSYYGIIPLLEKKLLKASSVVILDSDAFNIIVAQKGLIHFKVKIFGKKAHGAYPWAGINAIEIAARIIQDLKNFKFKYRRHQLLREPTINIGVIRGGDKVNVVSDWCEFEVDLRFLPGMKPEEIIKGIKNIIKKRSKKFSLEINSLQKPCEVEKHNPLVKTLLKSNRRFFPQASLKGSEGATVLTFFKQKKIPAVATGFGEPRLAHATNEYISLRYLYNGACAIEDFIKEFDKIEAN